MRARETIDLYATLADMKDVDYKNMLAVTTLMDLLVEKGILTRTEITERAKSINAASE